jgi:NTE family protein
VSDSVNLRKKVGLALSGGSARALAHVGVLEVLERENIPIDMIAGTSGGAIVGALYARSLEVASLKQHALDLAWTKVFPMLDISLSKTGLIKGNKIQDVLASYLGGNIEFKDLKIPFACVASDIDTGEEVVFNSGSVTKAVRASISLPGIFTLVKLNNRYLVDGALTTPVPVEVVKRMGADFVIAVSVLPDTIINSGEATKGHLIDQKEPNVFHVMMQFMHITSHKLVLESLHHSNVIIEPDVHNIGAADFHKVQECIMQGEKAALEALPEIKKKLNGL